jgi:hypothetical protein
MTYKQDTQAELNRDSFFRTRNLEIERRNNVYKKPSFILLLLLLVCVSYDSSAVECVTARGGYFNESYDAELVYFTKHGSELSTCIDTVLLTGLEYAVLIEQTNSGSTENLELLLVSLFEFDAEVFSIIEGALIIAFLTSHFTGRMVRTMGKHS